MRLLGRGLQKHCDGEAEKMKKQATKKGHGERDPIYKDVAAILKKDDPERVSLLRLFISELAESVPRKKPKT